MQLDTPISGLLAGLGDDIPPLLPRLGRYDGGLGLAGRRHRGDGIGDPAIMQLDVGDPAPLFGAGVEYPDPLPDRRGAATVTAKWLSISRGNVPPAFTATRPITASTMTGSPGDRPGTAAAAA